MSIRPKQSFLAQRCRRWRHVPAAGLLALALALSAGVRAQTSAATGCAPLEAADGFAEWGRTGEVGQVGPPGQCLLTRTFRTDGAGALSRVLVVFLPGDGGRSVAADSGTAFELARQLRATTVAVQRPVDGGEGSAAQVSRLAGALGQLRRTHPGQKILLVGHAGGAALTALLAARFPASADAFLLAACPCDLTAWQSLSSSPPVKAGAGDGPAVSLSPLTEARQMPPGTRISVVVGNRDDRTPPRLSEAYVAALQARGVATRLTYAMGATHVSVQRAPEFFMLAQSLADGLQASRTAP